MTSATVAYRGDLPPNLWEPKRDFPTESFEQHPKERTIDTMQ
jgi:hypothetical protein